MNPWIPMLGLLVSVAAARAQERVPDEEAKKVAALLVEAAAKAKLPLKVEVDAEKPYAKRKDDHGALVLPVKGLSAETIGKAGNEVTPIGHLWLKNLAPVVDNAVLSSKKLLIVPVTVNEMEHNLALCCLGVQTIKEKPMLVILSQNKTPLVAIPLEKLDQKQEMPIEFLVTIDGDQRASVVLQLMGKYRARLRIAALLD